MKVGDLVRIKSSQDIQNNYHSTPGLNEEMLSYYPGRTYAVERIVNHWTHGLIVTLVDAEWNWHEDWLEIVNIDNRVLE